MLKLLPVLLISMLVTSTNTMAEERWFQIEVITFVNPSNGNNVNEKYPLIQMQKHAFDKELSQLDMLNIEVLYYFQGYPVINLSIGETDNNGKPFEIDTGGISNISNNAPRSNTFDRFSNTERQIEQPFIKLNDDERLLRDKYRQLDRNSRFQILSFQAWRQHVGSEQEAINVRINGGINYNGQFNQHGHPLESKTSDMLNVADNQPQNEVTTELATQQNTVNQPYQQDNTITPEVDAFPNPMMNFLTSKWNQRNIDDIWELDGSVQVYIKKRYLHLMTQLAYREPADFGQFKYLEQQRIQHNIESESALLSVEAWQDESEANLDPQLNSLIGQEAEVTNSAIDRYLNSLSSNTSNKSSIETVQNTTEQSERIARQELAELAALDDVLNDEPKSGIVEYHLNTTRRLKSTEYHYIDHPKFGVLFLITPYTPNHLKQTAN